MIVYINTMQKIDAGRHCPGLRLTADDVAYDIETVNQWIRTILVGRRWLKRELEKSK